MPLPGLQSHLRARLRSQVSRQGRTDQPDPLPELHGDLCGAEGEEAGVRTQSVNSEKGA